MSDDIKLSEVIEGLTQITEKNLPELLKITPFNGIYGIYDGGKLIGLRHGFAHVYPGDYIWDFGYTNLLITKDDLKFIIQIFMTPEPVADCTQFSIRGEVPNPWKGSTYLNGV